MQILTARTWRLALGLLILSLVVFIALALVVPTGVLNEAERGFLLSLRDHDAPNMLAGPGWLLYFMKNVTALGGWPLLSLLSLMLTGAFILRKQYGYVWVLLIVVIGETVITGQLKDVFDRVRPDFLPHLTTATSESFPSGHAASAAAIYLTLGLMLANAVKRGAEKIYILGCAVVIIMLVGLSRVYLGVHYPSDVAAGWCIGAAWASAVWLAADRLRR